MSESALAERDVITNPMKGDQVGFRDKPDQRIELRFTDATGQECLWVVTTKVVKLKDWSRRMRGATVIRRGDAQQGEK